jgi:hypothetical protein
MVENNYWEVWDEFVGLIVETCKWSSRPRVKPLDWPEIKVNFPVKLREQNPIGTRFSINWKVSQKPNQAPYLYADRNSILVIKDYKPRKRVFAEKQKDMKSDRVYKYIEI